MSALSPDELLFQRMVNDLRYFCKHPEAAQPFWRGWTELADKVAMVAVSTGSINEHELVANEFNAMGKPDNKALAELSPSRQHWIVVTGSRYNSNVHTCCRCLVRQEDGASHHRLQGTMVYMCAPCFASTREPPEAWKTMVHETLTGQRRSVYP